MEGYSLKDKLVLFCFLLTPGLYKFLYYWWKDDKNPKFNLLPDLICDVILKNEDGIFFCGKKIGNVYITSSVHKRKLKKYLNIKQGAFIDIGAHIGKYTVMVGRMLKDNGKVVAIEPEENNCEMLKKNAILNKLELNKNIFIQNVACYYEDKDKIPLNLVEGGSTSGHSIYDETSKIVMRPAKKLDTILYELKIERVDLIKIDAEKAEADILKGAIEIIQRYHPKIIFEALDKEYLEKVKEVLRPFNYKIKEIDKVNYFAE
ncbi:MAG: hypothetical protein BWK75_06260 [Candidatus Altiarchaeales archaeon A3]|nr:MAG: hypothetical protein BWK75_06260 [Candidatus Altiarchaeales archaeon A3]